MFHCCNLNCVLTDLQSSLARSSEPPSINSHSWTRKQPKFGERLETVLLIVAAVLCGPIVTIPAISNISAYLRFSEKSAPRRNWICKSNLELICDGSSRSESIAHNGVLNRNSPTPPAAMFLNVTVRTLSEALLQLHRSGMRDDFPNRLFACLKSCFFVISIRTTKVRKASLSGSQYIQPRPLT